MKDFIKLGLIILVLVSVALVFISPAVDLEPTALRAAKMATLLFALLALAGTIFYARLSRAISPIAAACEADCALLLGRDVVDLNCSRLC